jgi:hypothetical protein
LLPWTGIMLVGYASASLFQTQAQLRDSRLIRIGGALVIGFVLLRAVDGYGDPVGCRPALSGLSLRRRGEGATSGLVAQLSLK